MSITGVNKAQEDNTRERLTEKKIDVDFEKHARRRSTNYKRTSTLVTVHVCDDRVERVVGVDDIHRATDFAARPSTNDGNSRRPVAGRQLQDGGPGGTKLVNDLRTNWAARATCMARRRHRRAISSADAATIVFLILLLLYFPHFFDYCLLSLSFSPVYSFPSFSLVY